VRVSAFIKGLGLKHFHGATSSIAANSFKGATSRKKGAKKGQFPGEKGAKKGQKKGAPIFSDKQ